MDIYKTLINKILSAGVRIHGEAGACAALNPWEAGAFDKDYNGLGPTILIRRPEASGRCNLIPSDVGGNAVAVFVDSSGNEEQIRDQLINISHEFGHYRSLLNKTRSKEYEAALNVFNDEARADPLTAPEGVLIRKEENIAWDNGKMELNVLKFGDSEYFDVMCGLALEKYEHAVKSPHPKCKFAK